MEAGKVDTITTERDHGYLGPAGIQVSICKIHVIRSVTASQEFYGKKKEIY